MDKKGIEISECGDLGQFQSVSYISLQHHSWGKEWPKTGDGRADRRIVQWPAKLGCPLCHLCQFMVSVASSEDIFWVNNLKAAEKSQVSFLLGGQLKFQLPKQSGRFWDIMLHRWGALSNGIIVSYKMVGTIQSHYYISIGWQSYWRMSASQWILAIWMNNWLHDFDA